MIHLLNMRWCQEFLDDTLVRQDFNNHLSLQDSSWLIKLGSHTFLMDTNKHKIIPIFQEETKIINGLAITSFLMLIGVVNKKNWAK